MSRPDTAGIVIAGAGLAAVRTAEELRAHGYDGALTIVGEQTELPYDRPPLTKEVLRGESDDSTLEPREFYADNAITLRLGVAAAGLDTAAQRLQLADGEALRYDSLVIATGLTPRHIPGLPAFDGIGTVRSIGDSRALRERVGRARRAVVVGAGFIGCEVAASLRSLGVSVSLVEPQPVPLASALGERVGGLIARMHREEGVDVRTGVGLAAVDGAADVESVRLSDGSVLAADVVVTGVGSVPVTDWLAGSGVRLEESDGGVACDATGRTSAHRVWAAGDVASWPGPDGRRARVEHWSNAVAQVRVLAPDVLGSAAPTDVYVPPYFWSDQYGLKIQCLGHPAAADTVHVVEDDGRKFLAYYERDGLLAATVGAGRPGKVMATRGRIADRAPIGDVLG